MRLLVLLAACGGALPIGGGDLGRSPGTCANQDDCPDGSICEPSTGGGKCMPPSTHHCAPCSSDADCGEDGLCFQAPGDDAMACHVDCSLSWLACPDGYNCAPVLHGSGMRRVCLPIENRCLDVVGGNCSPGQSQPCTRTNLAGSCSGVRDCMNGQLSACDAPEPAFLAHCGDAVPAGCNELPSPDAVSTTSDCGTCGNACPGVSSSTADTACVSGACGISCRGDNYDADGDASNGCETPDAQPGNHAQAGAIANGSTSCDDSSSQNSFQGQLISDARAHVNPTVLAFDSNVGAAPHWYSVFSSGGVLCQDDFSFTFTTSGGPAVSCYRATIITDKTTTSVTVTGAGSASTSGGSSSYSDNTTIYFKVEKTCSVMSVGGGDVSYTISYHL